MYIDSLLKYGWWDAAMDHMHRNGIFHRDIKPENILIMDDVLKVPPAQTSGEPAIHRHQSDIKYHRDHILQFRASWFFNLRYLITLDNNGISSQEPNEQISCALICVCELGPGVKLADFGSCRGVYSKQPYTEYISTRWYALLSWSQCVDISSCKVQNLQKYCDNTFVDQ